MSRALTLRRQRFITEYLKTGNATDAAAKAGYKGQRNTTLTSTAYELMTSPDIKSAIADALTRTEITPEYIILRLNEISLSAMKDSDKLRALEDLAKITQVSGFTNQTLNQFNGDITISFGKPQTTSQRIIEGEITPP